MTTNKQALREVAEKAISEEGETWWNEEQLASDYGLALHKADAKFIAAANPAVVLALLDELEARTSTLPPLNDDLIAILGRPNFTCAHLAELMRKSGEDIPRKSENEQAAVIHWFLRLYLEHGDKWESVAKADIQARVAAAGITTKGE